MISKQSNTSKFVVLVFASLLYFWKHVCISSVKIHLNTRADLLWLSLASNFMSVQLLLEHNRNVGFLNDQRVFAQQQAQCEQEGSPPGSGSKEFPGLTPKCLYIRIQKSVHLFPYSHFLSVPLADGAHNILTCLKRYVICAHTSMHAYVSVCFHSPCVTGSYI